MRAPCFVWLLLLIGSEALPLPLGNSEIGDKTVQGITAERVLHLRRDANRKVIQQTPLSLSNSDGHKQLATRFRTKRSAGLGSDYGIYNLHVQPADASYRQGPAGHLSPTNELQYQDPLQNTYYQPTQYEHSRLPQTEYYTQKNAQNAIYTNPYLNLQYYNTPLPNAYYNMPQLNTNYDPHWSNSQYQQYFNYQPQYWQGQQNAGYQMQPYYYPSQPLHYYNPLQYNTMWNANPYLTAPSQYAALQPNANAPLVGQQEPTPACANELQPDPMSVMGRELGALAAVDEGVPAYGHTRHDVEGYHEYIDALYDENNLENELGASEDYY